MDTATDDFAAYVAVRGDALFRSAMMLGCSRHDAEDVVQSALATCFRKWGAAQAASDVDAYVYRVLVNTIASKRRRRWNGEVPTGARIVADPHRRAGGAAAVP